MNIDSTKKQITEKKNKFNIGIALLRTLLCFMIVIIHVFDKKSTSNYLLLYLHGYLIYAVPTFFLLSFYLMANSLVAMNKKKMIQRLERLIIPYVMWPIIVLPIHNYCKFGCSKFKVKFNYLYHDLKLSLSYGFQNILPLWFLLNLIIFTIIFSIIIKIFRRNYIFILISLSVFCCQITYSGYYINLLIKLDKENLNFINIPSMFSICVLGFVLSFYKIAEKLEKNRVKTIFINLIMLHIITKYKIIIGYLNNLVCCPLLLLTFVLIPTTMLQKKNALSIIKKITNYTMGIYLMHMPMTRYYFKRTVENNLEVIKKVNFIGSIKIYLVCYFVGFICTCLFNKTKFRNLFV